MSGTAESSSAVQPFHDLDIGTVLDGAGQVGRGKCGVDDQGNLVFGCDCRDGVKVGHVEPGIAYRFTKESFRILGDGRFEIGWLVWINKFHVDSKCWQDVIKLCEGEIC